MIAGFIIFGITIISIGCTAGMLISMYFHKPLSGGFWELTLWISFSFTVIVAGVILALFKTGHLKIIKEVK